MLPPAPAPAPARLALLLSVLGAACDGGLEPEPICAGGLVGICGTLRFSGAIPESTDNVFVVAYPTFPQSCDDLFTFQPPFPPAVPYTDSVAAYSVALPAGRYEWVLAVWKKEGTPTFSPADTALLREAGHFRDPADTTRPGAVTVPAGGAAGTIDFRVRFDSLRPVSHYFTCAAG